MIFLTMRRQMSREKAKCHRSRSDEHIMLKREGGSTRATTGYGVTSTPYGVGHDDGE